MVPGGSGGPWWPNTRDLYYLGKLSLAVAVYGFARLHGGIQSDGLGFRVLLFLGTDGLILLTQVSAVGLRQGWTKVSSQASSPSFTSRSMSYRMTCLRPKGGALTFAVHYCARPFTLGFRV